MQLNFLHLKFRKLEHGMHTAEYTAVGIALVGLAIGVVLFAFAYNAVKSFAKTSLGAGLQTSAVMHLVSMRCMTSFCEALFVLRETVRP